MDMYLGKNLKLIRKAWRFTQDEMGVKLGANGKAYGMWETGKSKPKPKSIRLIEVITGLSFDNLCSREFIKEEIPMHPKSIVEEEKEDTSKIPHSISVGIDKSYNLMNYGELIEFVRLQDLRMKELEERLRKLEKGEGH